MNCSVNECEKKSRSRGMCEMHYYRWRKHGTTDKPLRKKSGPKPPCIVDECKNVAFARGWCRTHYTRWYDTGSVELGVRPPHRTNYTTTPIEERFWQKVEKGPDHWMWTGGTTTLGYGTIWDYDRQRNSMAHRVSWEIAYGQKIPEGLVIDHLCRIPGCVNPRHLQVVSISENTSRGLAPIMGGLHNSRKTHCPQGHEYTPENTYIYERGIGQSRVCRTCAIERTQERRRKKSQEQNPH